MGLFSKLTGKDKETSRQDYSSNAPSGSGPSAAPPIWAPAPEQSHKLGQYSDAPEDEYQEGERFCNSNPLDHPRLIPSHIVQRLHSEGCRAWGIEIPTTRRFQGHIQSTGEKGGPSVVSVQTQPGCQSVSLLSDLPIMAGLYDINHKTGVYYEVLIERMDGIIAPGTACRPYPSWRLPGWNRLSAGLHLDDTRKFWEDPDGGRDYSPILTRISPGDTIGCGYEFASTSIFFTYNGQRLPSAFNGIYTPRNELDVFAAIGVEGSNEFQVNFGGELFRWKEGNEYAWRVEGHVGQFAGRPGGAFDEDLPTYER